MRLNLKSLIVILFSVVTIISCRKESKPVASDEISPETLNQIFELGFSNQNVIRSDNGYIVEGDIFLSESDLTQKRPIQLLRVGNEEQYRTTNLVTGLPRTITVALDSRLASSSGYVQALDVMVSRYNTQKLLITFQRVGSGANITFSRANGSYLASSGFPSSSGTPYNSVKVNSRAIGSGTSSTFINYLATIFAHEVGHCIGFRHTDYMNRSYSCGGSPVNEGASTVGAIQIPGTPAGPDPNSWMLSCIGSGVNRPFNANDRTALNYLY